MTLTDALELFAYNKWANDRMLASLAPLAPDVLTRDLQSSFPTILATAAHIAGAEWIWLARWKGESPTGRPDWLALGLAGIREKFSEIEAERSAYLATLSTDALAKPLAFKTFAGVEDVRPLSVQIQHLVNHGTYHRGQVATMLRQVGVVPPATDLIQWVRER